MSSVDAARRSRSNDEGLFKTESDDDDDGVRIGRKENPHGGRPCVILVLTLSRVGVILTELRINLLSALSLLKYFFRGLKNNNSSSRNDCPILKKQERERERVRERRLGARTILSCFKKAPLFSCY